jgi:hypothetical protein
MTFVNREDFRAYVASEIVGDDPFVTLAQDSAEAAVVDWCGRSFTLVDPGTPTARTYAASADRRRVVIDDIADATGLVVSDAGSTVAAADYQRGPLGWVNDGRPFYELLRLGYWSTPTYPGTATVTVTTDQWGWPSLPVQVQEATMVLGKDLLHLRPNRFGVAGFGEFGVVRIRENPHVQMLLSRLRHPRAFGVA